MRLLQGLVLGGAVGGSSSLSVGGGCSSFSGHRPSDAPLLHPKKQGLSLLAPSDNATHRPLPKNPSVTTSMVGPAAPAGRETQADGVGGETVSFRSAAAQEYHERRREALGAWTEQRQGRELCERCRRARKMCLCSSLPAQALPTSTRFVILQHPAETKKRVTGTVPLVLHCLSNCRRVVMRSDYGESELRNVLGIGDGEGDDGGGEGAGDDSSGDSSFCSLNGADNAPLLLFPCPGSEYLEDIAAERERTVPSASPPPRPATTPTAASASPPSPPPSASPPGTVVVLVDGTWSQAKQILSRYPFLSPQKPSVVGPGGRGLKLTSLSGAPATGSGEHGVGSREEEGKNEEGKDAATEGGDAAAEGGRRSGGAPLCRAVKFRSAGVSSYGFRREPTKECISTLESVAYTLEVLEGTPEGLAAAAYLRKSFSAMVAMQLEAADAAGSRPRFINRKGRTANRRSTPPKTDNKTETGR